MPNIPILTLLVTFLHEFGHALGALVSGGHVKFLQVNLDGSGLCSTYGGNSALITCGGYIGSVLFGNIMLYIGLRNKILSKFLSMGLALCMVVVSLIWFSTISSFLLTAFIGGLLLFVFSKIPWSGRAFLLLAGAYSVLYVIADYKVGPSSDLQAFASIMGLTPLIWMYLWLGLAVVITAFFVKKGLTKL